MRSIQRDYPQANMIAVDYDPGASEVNQLNRIKLMLTAAARASVGAGDLLPRRSEDGCSGSCSSCGGSCGEPVMAGAVHGKYDL